MLWSGARLFRTPRGPNPCPQRAIIAGADDFRSIESYCHNDALVPPQRHGALPCCEICDSYHSVYTTRNDLKEGGVARGDETPSH